MSDLIGGLDPWDRTNDICENSDQEHCAHHGCEMIGDLRERGIKLLTELDAESAVRCDQCQLAWHTECLPDTVRKADNGKSLCEECFYELATEWAKKNKKGGNKKKKKGNKKKKKK